MVKRKASENIEEWLREGETISAARTPTSYIAPGPQLATVSPTAEVSPVQVVEESPAVAPADMEVNANEAANWFWELLAQDGFEIW